MLLPFKLNQIGLSSLTSAKIANPTQRPGCAYNANQKNLTHPPHVSPDSPSKPSLPQTNKQTNKHSFFNTPEPAKPQSLNGTTAILSLTSPYLTSPYLIHPANPSSPPPSFLSRNRHLSHSFIHPTPPLSNPPPPRAKPPASSPPDPKPSVRTARWPRRTCARGRGF